MLLLPPCPCRLFYSTLLLQLLYQDWLQLPPQLMTVKEAVLLLQRLAYVQDRFDADPATCAKWHCLFLDIVYNICTSSTLPPVSRSNLVEPGQTWAYMTAPRSLVKPGHICVHGLCIISLMCVAVIIAASAKLNIDIT